MVVKFTQAYMTTDYPDENGNYYYPVFVPENAHVQLPIVTSMPDASLGNRGIRYDWNTNSWTVSSDDPLIKKINTLEAQLNGLVPASKDDNNTNPNNIPVDPNQAQSASSASSADSSSTAPASSAGGSLSNMMDMFNGVNHAPASAGDQAQPATADSNVAEQEDKAESSTAINSVNPDTPDPTKESDK
jgi:hypothetical protein